MDRAHLQLVRWKHILTGDVPLESESYGFEADHEITCLNPTFKKAGTPDSPESLLKLIRCGCSSGEPCKSGNCGCMGHQLPYTIFCACGGDSKVCCNPFNRHDDVDEDDESTDY